MKRTLLLLLFGLIMMIGGCIPFGVAFNNSFNVNQVLNESIAISKKFTRSPILVNSDFLILSSIKVHITSNEIKHNSASDQNEYQAKFRFPLTLIIKNSVNKILYEYNNDLDWNSGSRSYQRNEVNARSGEVIVEFDLEKIDLHDSKEISVSVLLNEDNFYFSKLQSASLIIYDNVHDYTANIVTGIAIIFSGSIILIIAIVMLIIKQTRNNLSLQGRTSMDEDNITENDLKLDNSTITTSAMLCHLSTFAGLIIPFGGVLGPLVMWQIKKDDDPFIDRHGIAALNFHLSMMIYYFISFLFAFIIIGFLFLMILAVTDLILTIIASIKASNGEEYRYPITISFIKYPESASE